MSMIRLSKLTQGHLVILMSLRCGKQVLKKHLTLLLFYILLLITLLIISATISIVIALVPIILEVKGSDLLNFKEVRK